MKTTPSKEFLRIETWLTVLIATYKSHPSNGLAQTISFYLSTLLNHDDICFCGDKRCDYLAMQRYWRWYAIRKSPGLSL
ncbi:hypothetical protein KO495_13425 [Colwellia sp. D2M02]|uniref:Uncharacterized protein n=1 Tax=Colwellia asteriadis TaxID=517723 RepID=A0ABP3WMJ7_9GAMM|nr:hypothetical protein [Colwellia sp. D2M02]MBU2894309.1 hypothetical protein [Colwellia sp. D2M02]